MLILRQSKLCILDAVLLSLAAGGFGMGVAVCHQANLPMRSSSRVDQIASHPVHSAVVGSGSQPGGRTSAQPTPGEKAAALSTSAKAAAAGADPADADPPDATEEEDDDSWLRTGVYWTDIPAAVAC